MKLIRCHQLLENVPVCFWLGNASSSPETPLSSVKARTGMNIHGRHALSRYLKSEEPSSEYLVVHFILVGWEGREFELLVEFELLLGYLCLTDCRKVK